MLHDQTDLKNKEMETKTTSKKMPLAISAVCKQRAAGLRQSRHHFRKRFLPNQLSCTSKGESTQNRRISNSFVFYYQQQSSKFENTGAQKDMTLCFSQMKISLVIRSGNHRHALCPESAEGKGHSPQLPSSSHPLTNSSWAAFISRESNRTAQSENL